jgi:carboxyl-terminal processing protease
MFFIKNKLKLLQFVLAISTAGLLGYYIGANNIKISWDNYKPSASVVNKEVPPEIENVDFDLFWRVWNNLENKYYDKTKLDPQKMLHGAISGLTKSIEDPYTVFLPPKQNSDFKEGLAGQFSGIGAELGMENNQVVVIAPLKDSPAERAGILAGDSILNVDGDSTFDWTIAKAVEEIRGLKGTEVVLTVLHKDNGDPEDIKIIRDVIKLESVVGWVKEAKDIENIELSEDKNGKIAYVRVSQFGDRTNENWLSAINDISFEMQSQNVKGLIVDVRNNPGGYLGDAVNIASEFLAKGTPVVIEENFRNEKKTLSVERVGLINDLPVIVLINRGSASASEIVAGALRDHKRAILIGEKSFGKGTIQQAQDLGDGAGIHITIAKWLTPDGIWVNQEGLTPDIEVKLNKDEPTRDLQLERAVVELLK